MTLTVYDKNGLIKAQNKGVARVVRTRKGELYAYLDVDGVIVRYEYKARSYAWFEVGNK